MAEKKEFKVPSDMESLAKDIKIDDADYDPSGDHLAVLTPIAVHIKNRNDDKFIATLSPLGGFRFRCVRFLKSRRDMTSLLVTIENGREGGFPILCIWNTQSWTRIRRTVVFTRRQITTLSVGKDGKLIAVGSADGSVGVYDSQLYVQDPSLP